MQSNLFSLNGCLVFGFAMIHSLFSHRSTHGWLRCFSSFAVAAELQWASLVGVDVRGWLTLGYAWTWNCRIVESAHLQPYEKLWITLVSPWLNELLPAACKKWYLVLICVPWSLSEVEHLFMFISCVSLSCELPFPVLCFILFGSLVFFF